jgi:predicted amidohydrolase
MTETIRLAGAQIPCTDNLKENIKHIKNAIKWAGDNNVDYLLTPEGSLSGYFPGWDEYKERTIDDIYTAERELVDYAVQNKVGLCLGTMWGETDDTFPQGYRKENQIRFYSNTGKLLGTSNKMYVLPSYDQTVVSEDVSVIDMHHSPQNFWATGLVCNDFWGGPLKNQISLPIYAAEQKNTQVIFHATNGFRGELPVYDEITDAWHEGNLRMISFAIGIPIVTVDNACKMNGIEGDYEGKTSSTSGILLNGEWKVKAPRNGIHYFYYDFNYNDVINYNLKRHPDQDIIDKNPHIGGCY